MPHRVEVARSLTGTALLLTLCGACVSPPLRPSGPTSLEVQEETSFLESDGHRIKVDVYQPAHGRYPAVILLHGSGGIHAIIESQINRYAQALAQLGIVAYVVHYFDYTSNFTSDEAYEKENYFHWVRAVREAVTWVLARPDVRGRQVGILGHSLGAYLAVGVAAQEPRVRSIVLLGGGLEPYVADSIRRMPPVLIFHGQNDDVVPLSEANHLEDFLTMHKFSAKLTVLPGERHVFSDAAADSVLAQAARFLAPAARRQRTP